MPENLLCLYTGRISKDDGTFRIEVPENEVAVGRLREGEVYRVGLYSAAADGAPLEDDTEGTAGGQGAEPPVETGEVIEVDIEDIGD